MFFFDSFSSSSLLGCCGSLDPLAGPDGDVVAPDSEFCPSD
jgi:hypothetical protein